MVQGNELKGVARVELINWGKVLEIEHNKTEIIKGKEVEMHDAYGKISTVSRFNVEVTDIELNISNEEI